MPRTGRVLPIWKIPSIPSSAEPDKNFELKFLRFADDMESVQESGRSVVPANGEGVVMDISAINRVATGVHAPDPLVPADKVAEKQEVVRAIKAVNGTEMFGPENEL